MEILNEGRYGLHVPRQKFLSHHFSGCPNFKKKLLLAEHYLYMFESFGDIRAF